MSERQVVHLKVAGDSVVNRVADAILKIYEEGYEIEVTTVGAGALNQAQKAIISAQSRLATKGMHILEKSMFGYVTMGGAERTSIRKRLIIEQVRG